MAAVTLLGTATFDTNSGTKTVTATPAAGDLIVLVTAHTGNTATTAPTDNNGDGRGLYVEVASAVKATSADTLKMWVRVALVGSASSTVFTHAPGTTSGGGVAVMKITGMSRVGLNAIRQSALQSNQSSGGTPTPVLGTAALTGNALIGAVFNASNTAGMTPRSSPAYSERADVGYNTPASGLEVMSIDSGETATSIAWGGTSASAFCSMVAELDTSVPPPLEEQGDDWWSGAQNCFVGVAIAGAAAAFNLSGDISEAFFRHNDELSASIPGAAAGAPPTQRMKHTPVFQRWYVADELPPQSSALPIDEEPAPALSPSKDSATFIIWATSDEFVPPPTFRPEEDYWQPLVVAPSRVTLPAVWVESDELPPHPSDDYWQQFPPSGRTPIAQVWLEQDDLPTLAATLVEEEPWQSPVLAAAAPRIQLWTDQDEVATPPAALFYEEYWHQLGWLTPEPIVRLWHQQDEMTTAVASLPVDELYWQRPVVWPAPGPQPAATADDEIVPQPTFPPSDDYWLRFTILAVDPIAAVWTHQDEVARLPVDEAYWQQPYSLPVYPAKPAATADDEIVPQPVFSPREEYELRLFSITVHPLVRVWNQQDDVPTEPPPVTVVLSAPPIGHRTQGTRRPSNTQTASRVRPQTRNR